MAGYSVAYGGRPYGMPADAVAGGHQTSGAGVPQNARVYAGGTPWVDEPAKCEHPMKNTGWPCENAPVKGTTHCIGHRRAAEKQQRGS